jgi:2,4-dienoyl-CoA reductase-like NADH-dependent reductase (Old Yellow Enzyme family)
MFLAPQFGTQPDLIPGLPMATLLPFLLGAGLIAIPYAASRSIKKGSTMSDILKAGGAAAIGFGVATYANWVLPVSAGVSRARAAPIRRATYVPPNTYKPTVTASVPGAKVI